MRFVSPVIDGAIRRRDRGTGSLGDEFLLENIGCRLFLFPAPLPFPFLSPAFRPVVRRSSCNLSALGGYYVPRRRYYKKIRQRRAILNTKRGWNRDLWFIMVNVNPGWNILIEHRYLLFHANLSRFTRRAIISHVIDQVSLCSSRCIIFYVSFSCSPSLLSSLKYCRVNYPQNQSGNFLTTWCILKVKDNK